MPTLGKMLYTIKQELQIPDTLQLLIVHDAKMNRPPQLRIETKDSTVKLEELSNFCEINNWHHSPVSIVSRGNNKVAYSLLITRKMFNQLSQLFDFNYIELLGNARAFRDLFAGENTNHTNINTNNNEASAASTDKKRFLRS